MTSQQGTIDFSYSNQEPLNKWLRIS